MRLPTINQFKNQIDAISTQYNAIRNLQVQISSGKKLTIASEDPVLAERVKSVEDLLQSTKGYELNGSLALNRNSLMSSLVQDGLDAFAKIKELVIAAQNDTLNENDRKNIGTELQGFMEHLLHIANTQNNNGEYLFSGMNTHTEPYIFTGANYIYQGAEITTKIPVGLNNSVDYNEAGSRLFSNTNSGTLFDLLQDTINILNTPTPTQADKDNLHALLDANTIKISDFSNSFIQYQNTLGNRGQTIDMAITVNKNLVLDGQILLSRLADADLGEVVSNLTQQMTQLELMQSSYLRVQETLQQFLKNKFA